jgi:TonB-dependent starch-binding outer membrane protein SusC
VRGSLERFDRDHTVVTLEYRGTVSYPREGNITSNFTFGVQGFREETSTIWSRGETLLPGTENFGEAGIISSTEGRSQIFNGGVFFQPTERGRAAIDCPISKCATRQSEC